MAGGSGFKSYQRDMRIQTSEETFDKGQVFTRAPLTTGKVRVLANYDLINEGEAITNRKGIRPTMVGLPFNVSGLAPTLTSNVSITQCYDAVEEDDTHYRLVIANQFAPNATPIPNINLYSAPAELWVIKSDENATSYKSLNEYDIDSKNMYAIPLSYELPDAEAFSTMKTYAVGDFCIYDTKIYRCKVAITTAGAWDATKWELYVYPKSYYHVPDNPKAHGIKLTHEEYLGKPVGSFAFGNDYYNFNTDGDLVRSIYQTAEEEPEEYSSSKTYAVGDLCKHDNSNWKCITAITTPEAWNSAKWQAYTLIGATFLVEKMSPKEITATEAMSFGFNMLSKTPFVFNDSFESGTAQLQGIMIYNSNDIITEPLLNTNYTLRCFYTAQAGTTYKMIFSYRETNENDWTTIKEQEYVMTQDATHTAPPEVTAEHFSSAYSDTVIRVQAFKKSGSSYPDEPETELKMGVSFVKSPSSPVANKELKNYDLSKATGMTYWKSHIWLYGLAQDPTVLFASDINEPTYFPYPNNVDIFDEPIVNVVPFNDNLLVFTRSILYQITLSSDGGWTRKVLQGNLNFNDFDARFVQIVKNMIFFKSGDYYYMIVPKTLSLQNELAIAPVSKNIEQFLDDFETNATNLFQILYDYEGSLELVNHYNYLNYEDVHNVYVFQTNTNLFLNLTLLYNTIERNWRMYVYESQTMYYPLKQDATKTSELITPIYVKFNINGTDTTVAGAEFLEHTRDSIKDFYIPKNSTIRYADNEWKHDNGAIETAFNTLHVFKNYQLVDTGYREHALDYNKRYRELQFKFNNVGTAQINFITEFILDGDTRINRYKYETEHITDPNAANYGLIYISRTPIENLEVPGATILAVNSSDINAWTLDRSRFPEVAYWKARLKVSGKGYTPRFRLISRTEEKYELLGYTWIYRQMYSR